MDATAKSVHMGRVPVKGTRDRDMTYRVRLSGVPTAAGPKTILTPRRILVLLPRIVRIGRQRTRYASDVFTKACSRKENIRDAPPP